MQKVTIFNIYCTDLEYTLDLLDLKLVDDMDQPIQLGNYYMCPLKPELFSTNDMAKLTIEHVPERSLGGKGIILTCKEINNSDGIGKDVDILNFFKTKNFTINGKSIQAKLRVPALNHSSKGHFSLVKNFDGCNKLSYQISKKNSLQLGFDKVKKITSFKSPTTISIDFSQKINQSALLKAAYLIAFSNIGYKLLFNKCGFKTESYGLIIRELQKIKLDDDFPFVYFPNLDIEMPDDIGVLKIANDNFLLVKVKYTLDNHEFLYYCVLPYLNDDSLVKIKNLKINHHIDIKKLNMTVSKIPQEMLVKKIFSK